MKCYNYLIVVVFLIQSMLYAAPENTSIHIKIDQFGYVPNTEKIAVLSNPIIGFNANETFIPGETYEVRDWESDEVVFSKNIAAWNDGEVHEQSGDQVWWFDFSALTTEGTYYIYDPANEVGSFQFRIAEDVYNEVLETALHMFYYQRCGAAHTAEHGGDWHDHTACHVRGNQDVAARSILRPNDASTALDLSGGWHDAGDYNKYVYGAYSPVHNLLFAYQERPAIWDDNSNIPESGNGIPDILDEIKWELDWLLKMQLSDGSVLMKVSVPEYDGSSPPSSSDIPRYYAPAQASATRVVASIFAHAALVFSSLDNPAMNAYADLLLQRAELAWAWIEENPEPSTYDNEGFFSANPEIDADIQRDILTCSAALLYAATGDTEYRYYFDANYEQVWPYASNFWFQYNEAPIFQEILLFYTELPNATPEVVTNIEANAYEAINAEWTSLYYQYITAADAYSAHTFDQDYTWGSNAGKCHLANTIFSMNVHALDTDNQGGYSNATLGYLYNLHGVNPHNLVMLSNMDEAENSCQEIYHAWFGDGTDYDGENSLYGAPPGYLVGGPNRYFAPDPRCECTLEPPQNQPFQKSYLDWNGDWPENSWELSEPSIAYQAAYVRLVAHFVSEEDSNSPRVVHPVTGEELTNIACINTVQTYATYCRDIEWSMDCQRLYEACTGESTISPFIHIDQFGYQTEVNKWAVLSDPMEGYNAYLSYTPSNTLEVRNAENDAVVFTGTPTVWNNGATHGQSGDRGWWFDFSSVTTPGTYYVFDAENNQRSAEFEIRDDVYAEVLKQAGRMFYYNRSNTAKEEPYADARWTDVEDFSNPGQFGSARNFFDQDNPASARDLAGGWYDAGDYNKYTTFTNGTLHNLMWAFIENPEAFGDDWNIPESGNGIPDMLDEIKWELDWLFKMNNADGSTLLKIGSLDYDINSLSPPSANTDPFFYLPECSSAAIAVVSTFAQAAKIFREYPATREFAQELENRAITTWNYVLPRLNNNQLDEDCDNSEVVAGDADWRASLQRGVAVLGAIYLFDLTGEAAYNDYVIENIEDTENIERFSPWSYSGSNINEGRVHYASLENADPTTRDFILNSLRRNLNDNLMQFREEDLYRAYIPDWAYHAGSTLSQVNFALLRTMVVKSNVAVDDNAEYQATANEYLHYLHGVNPQGITYLSNMYDYGGDYCADEIFHLWFQDGSEWDNVHTSSGPPPGYLVSGPHGSYLSYQQTPAPSPPANQPPQKGYWSFNDPNYPSWAITEPGIYYQAGYIRLLAEYVTRGRPTATCDDGIQNGDETGIDCGGSECPACDCNNMTLVILFDNYPEETSWDIQDNAGNILASGGPYNDFEPGSLHSTTICLPAACYDFTIYDSFGDGICCDEGDGAFVLLNNAGGAILANGGLFGQENSTNFCLNQVSNSDASTDIMQLAMNSIETTLAANQDEMSTGTKNQLLEAGRVNIFPNPSDGYFKGQFDTAKNELVSLVVTDMLGRTLRRTTISTNAVFSLDLSELADGVYFVQIDEKYIKRIAVTR